MASISIVVNVADLDPLLARLEMAPSLMREASDKAMLPSVLAVQEQVRDRTPVVTGRLISSERWDVGINATEVTGAVFTNVSYAPYVEGGRGPVEAKRAKALRFQSRDGKLIFRKRVGPAAGRHMFREGWQAARPEVIRFFVDAARDVTRAIAGK